MRRFTGSQHGRRYNATDPCNATTDVSSVVVKMQESVAIEEDEEDGVQMQADSDEESIPPRPYFGKPWSS